MYQLSWSQFLSPLDLAWLIWHDILIFNKPRPNKVNPRLYEKKRFIFFFLITCSKGLQQILMANPTVGLVPSFNQSVQNTNPRQS